MDNIDQKLDSIYDTLDEHFRNGRFAEVDEILTKIDVEKENTDVLLGYLTASLPASHKLKTRRGFYKKVEIKFNKTYTWKETVELLRGLSR